MRHQFIRLTTLACVSLTSGLTLLSMRAAGADCVPLPPALKSGDLHWPVWERNWVAGNPAPTTMRKGVWNSLGEYQRATSNQNSSMWLHSGIDINGQWYGAPLNEGDFVHAAASGHVWAAHYYTDGCEDASQCKIVVRGADSRYYYYYAHLNIMPKADGDYHVDVRKRIEKALKNTSPDAVDPETAISQGNLLSGLGPFYAPPQGGPMFTHLHFSVFDACDNYDSLDPLDYLRVPHDDKHKPVVEDVEFAEGNSSINLSDHCQRIESSNLDIVAKMRDVWDDSNEWPGNEDLGVHRARLVVRNLTTGTTELERTWYRHDRLPFLCRGPNKGLACLDGPDPVGSNTTPMDLAEFMKEMKIDPFPTTAQGPFMSDHFVPALFRVVQPYKSENRDHQGESVQYYHQMTAEWALHGEGGLGGTIDTTNGGDIPKGWYQFSVEAFDRAGNGTAAHRFARVRQGSNGGQPFNQAPGDLVIRDNPKDIGAVPSTLGGEVHFKSGDIHVVQPGDPVDPLHVLESEGFWQPQAISVTQGIDETLWLRIKNAGCKEVNDPIWVTVIETNAALINDPSQFNYVESGTKAKHIDHPSGPLYPGEYGVVEFTWTPQQTGHLCLIAAVHSADDPSSIPFSNGEFDFSALENPSDKAHVPWANNLAQRNVSIAGHNFELGNPFGELIDLGIVFECNDFPLDYPPIGAAGAELVVDYDPALAAAWAGVPGTVLVDTGTELILSFHKCRVELPRATLPALTVLNAKMDLWLPTIVTGTYDVDLTALVNGVPHGGMSFRIEH
jgi:hypothetical protein